MRRTLNGFAAIPLSVLVFNTRAYGAEMGTLAGSLTLEKIINLVVEGLVKYSFQVLGGLVILAIGWVIGNFLAKYVAKFLSTKKIDVPVARFLVSIFKMMIMAMALVLALSKFGIEIAPIIAGLSVIGVGISLAMQGLLANYAAGISLIFTKPFKVGDIIEVVNEMGEVLDMTLPRTILRTVDGTIIYIPNKHIIGEIIHNYSDHKKLDIKVGVSYKTDVPKAIEILRQIIKNDARIRQTQEVKVGITEFGDSSINLTARVWCKQIEYWNVLFGVNRKIYDEFKSQGIEIPFPQRDVHLYDHRA